MLGAVPLLGAVPSLALGAIFLVAGGSKIAAGTAWPRQAAELGAPRSVALVLPWWELTLGAVLAVHLATRIVGVLALLSLLGFTAALVVRLEQGRHPLCACFGAWRATPIGWGHVARNVAFVALAVVVIVVG